MRALCAEERTIGSRKRFDCSTLQSIADKESANRDQARNFGSSIFLLHFLLETQIRVAL